MDPQSVAPEATITNNEQVPAKATGLDDLLKELNFPSRVVDSPLDVSVNLVHEWVGLVKDKFGSGSTPWRNHTFSDRVFLEDLIRSCVAKDKLIEFANLPIIFRGDSPINEGGYIRVLSAEVRDDQNSARTALVFEIRNAYGDWVGIDPRDNTSVITVPQMPFLFGVAAEHRSDQGDLRLIKATRAPRFEKGLYKELEKVGSAR